MHIPFINYTKMHPKIPFRIAKSSTTNLLYGISSGRIFRLEHLKLLVQRVLDKDFLFILVLMHL